MEKVRKYSSFEDMKDTATSGTVRDAVLADRHKRFESFMDFLRGDNPPEKSHPKAAKQPV
ncbi:hypothetical protein [Dyadobacter pollutisoli]|uniref:Uncharacterized protein n=1 Tax=Dyadobacter pollutisoli TaxID=2910158 RepID=A0A9E8NAV7_9BACT|nr:hypothetical protein [Dyadobacter pollutisoli]WAC13175.1 hypothetical protein ON006_04255 [Dyadobacter pollutisoli]